MGITTATRGVLAGVAAVCLAVGLGACGTSESSVEGPQFDPAGPTLGTKPPPGDWVDVTHSSGLLYSVPPDWQVLGAGAGGSDGSDGSGGSDGSDGSDSPGPGGPDGPGRAGDDGGTDWGFGLITTANAQTGVGYCGPVDSFRLRVGLTAQREGTVADVAEDMASTMSDAMETTFSVNGSTVDSSEPETVGVSGALALHQVLIGHPHEPRNSCTPPRFRVDILAVQMGTPEQPSVVAMLLIADMDEPGVVPEEVIDKVVGSLRFNNVL